MTVEHKVTCPFCLDVLPLATPVEGNENDAPANGDFSICFECGKVGIFDSARKGGLRKPTTAEHDELHGRSEIAALLQEWRRQKARL